MIRAAAAAGVDAVKFQTYTADTITLPVDNGTFRISEDHPLWPGARLYDLYEVAHTPWEWHAEGFALARELGIEAFSSPFDKTATDFLEAFDPPVYKIASMEIVDLPLIPYVASTGRPIIISVGTANGDEIAAVVDAAQSGGATDIVLLQCTSAYPADPADANLRALGLLRKEFGVSVGLSDHTMGIGVSVAAVALGARMIEKHFTLSRADGGVDSGFSLEPTELAQLVTEVRRGYLALRSPRVAAGNAEGNRCGFVDLSTLRKTSCAAMSLPNPTSVPSVPQVGCHRLTLSTCLAGRSPRMPRSAPRCRGILSVVKGTDAKPYSTSSLTTPLQCRRF